jgi:iron complex outermembrane receptor protein
MRLSKFTLLASSGLSAFLLAQPAFAQDASGAATQVASSSATPPEAAAPAPDTAGSMTPADASAPTPAQGSDGGDIVVLGFGQSRQVQSISAKDMEVIVPGASPLKAIEKLPGVNFQSSDAFGNYEWAVQISLRGFDESRLGFTLDGIPLGTMGYATVDNLAISRALISENLGSAQVAQGAGALGTASTSNLGGTIEYFSDSPKDKMDVTGSGTYGSNNTYRLYARVDSGLIGDVVKGYVSYADYSTDLWKGYGVQKQQQVNAKVTADLGPLGDISAFFAYSNRQENDYQDLSLNIISRRGLDDQNISNNYPLAQQIAAASQNGTPYPAGFATADDAYYDSAGLRRDYLGGITFNANLAPDLNLKTTGYYHTDKGQGSWITPYQVTPYGAPNSNGTPITDPADLSYRTTEYAMNRGGALSTATWEKGANTFEVGAWYQTETLEIARRFYGMTADAPNRSVLEYQTDPFYTQWDGKYDTETFQYHVQDTLKLLDDKLVLTGGWKGMSVTNNGVMIVGDLAQGTIQAQNWFLPQASALYHLSSDLELFADVSKNMDAFTASAASAPYAETQAAFDANKNTLKPETSKTIEGGLRYRTGGFQVSAATYFTDFENRLLVFSNGAGIIGNPPTLNNAGSVHSYGAELSANYRVTPAVTLFASYSYNNSKYMDNVVDSNGNILQATAGKTVVDSPKNMIKGDIEYNQYGILARIGGNYMSKRYFTYLNDQSVPGYVVFDASLGYHFKTDGALHGVSITGNVTNLFNKAYIGAMGTNGYTASGDFQTLQAGAPRQFFITLAKGF